MGKYLVEAELPWVALQPLILSHGYKLRPRYDPSWKPPWKKSKPWHFDKNPADFEESLLIRRVDVIDAVRIQDGAKVVIKRTILEYDNIPLLEDLNTPEMRQDPRNNAVPLLDVIPVPQSDEDLVSNTHTMLLVMPMLFTLISYDLPFRHAREVTDALHQIFQGVEFLHEMRVAHRDACRYNFMMDPTDVIPSSFHFSRPYCQPDGKTRIDFKDRCTVPTVKYYIIDFETAGYFPPGILAIGCCGQEHDAPELSDTIPYDPFKLDIYQMGKLVRAFIKVYEGLEFLAPLDELMTRREPEMRLTAAECVKQLQHMVSSLEDDVLAQEIWVRKSSPRERLWQTVPPPPAPPAPPAPPKKTPWTGFSAVNTMFRNIFSHSTSITKAAFAQI